MKINVIITALPLVVTATSCTSSEQNPNVIIILTDDQGYQDLGCYGSPLIATPYIDRMAAQGLRLTDFYQSASVSSASRAGLLTGRRNDVNGVEAVFFPNEGGLPSSERTLAESLRDCGYATACVGKWHLGDAPDQMPLNQGFDEYFGIPYSNDMYISPRIDVAEDVLLREGYTMEQLRSDQAVALRGRKAATAAKIKNRSPLVDMDKVVEFPCDQSSLTRRYFDRAMDFIKRSKDAGRPFFTYITPAMPHFPLYASEQFKGKSERGLYGDCVEEIDWNIGRLLDMLDSEGLSKNTIVIFTSDNGPWLQKGEDGGSAGPLRGGKFMHYDGGMRVPCIVRWSGTIPAGVVSDAVVASIDLFPTITHLAGGEVNHSVDGADISRFLKDPSQREGRDEYTYVKNGELHGVRKGDWVYLPFSGENIHKSKTSPELFNIKRNIAEDENLIESNPERFAQMKALFESKRR